MAPLTPSTIFTTLHKRDSDCTYYDASCSTHRLAIMIIIICVGIIVSTILSFLYVRSRRSKAAKMRTVMIQQQHPHQQCMKTMDGFNINTYPTITEMQPAAPPPYEPRRPERVASPNNNNNEWV